MTTQPRTRVPPAEGGTEEVCYLYAVVPAGARVPEELSGARGGEVSLVRHRDLAGVVSELRPGKPLGSRDDLMAHRRVVAALAAETTTLPMRFGAVVTTPDAVVEEMLEPYHDWFTGVLEELRGRQEIVVIGTYVEETMLREVLEEEPEVARLRESVRDLPEDAAYYERVRLGELIVQALDEKRTADAETLVRALGPYAAGTAERRPASEDTAVDMAFLVDEEDRKRFEEAVDDLGERWAGRIRLRVLGPLPAYDFVPSGFDEG